GLDTPLGFVTLFEQSQTFASVKLFDFSNANECFPPAPAPNLGTLDGGVLTLNVGARGNLRGIKPGEIDETYGLTYDDAGTADPSDDLLVLNAFSQKQTFLLSTVTRIIGDAGDGKD